jgi:hypothetical protein
MRYIDENENEKKKNEKKIKQLMLKQFEGLGGVGFSESDVDGGSVEFLPFVCNTLAF